MSWPTLYGHAAVWDRLMRLLAAERLPHALLFTGPPGIGKALLARRLMARLACTGAAGEHSDSEARADASARGLRKGRRAADAARASGPAAETARVPCGECPGCRQVAAGSHPDLFALGAPDRAAERGGREARRKEIGIDQSRALKRFAALHAVAAPRKMAIIDDADRLSVAAQNALLKTLEEPPGQALIVLVSAAPGALLPTVRSRCQRVLLRPLVEEEVRAVLMASGVPTAEAAALAAAADGSPGRALALRDTWDEADRRDMERLLAALDAARYGSVLAMSKGLGSSEPETAARLDGLLGLCRTAATTAAAQGSPDALDRALRRAEAVAEALRTLRWRNPNRGLLTEALALRLARI
jgi:DNA polymerase-3 subunit delta'